MGDIFRTIKNKNYTVMSNHHLQNPNLSLKAMGLMSKILSLPEDWNYSVKGLAANCKDGYESVRTALLELEAEGYLIRRTIRGERGKIAGTEYVFRENPDMEIPEGEEFQNEKAITYNKEKVEKRKEESADMQSGENEQKKSPELENPIPVGKIQEESPESDFLSTGNQEQQNTNKQNTIYNIYTSSSSYEEKAIYNSQEEREEKLAEKIKQQISYEALCREYGNTIPDEILKLLLEINGQGDSMPFYLISGQKVELAVLREKLSKLDHAHVQAILEGIATGPPVRNAKRYLLTALYQSDMAVHINNLRRKGGQKRNSFNNFHQRNYDYTDLERRLLGWKK